MFLGYGYGRFANMTTYSIGVSSVPVAIAANNINIDNHRDLVVANSGSNDVSMF
jgi:hypothetical protein